MRPLLLFVLAAVLHAPPIPLCTPGVSWVQQKLFDALSRFENCRAWNNPGCLKYARQPGARPGPHSYAIFRSFADGQRALRARIALRAGCKVGDFLARYNPDRKGYPEKIERLAHLDGEDRL
jgi:hypothetical protein